MTRPLILNTTSLPLDVKCAALLSEKTERQLNYSHVFFVLNLRYCPQEASELGYVKDEVRNGTESVSQAKQPNYATNIIPNPIIKYVSSEEDSFLLIYNHVSVPKEANYFCSELQRRKTPK